MFRESRVGESDSDPMLTPAWSSRCRRRRPGSPLGDASCSLLRRPGERSLPLGRPQLRGEGAHRVLGERRRPS